MGFLDWLFQKKRRNSPKGTGAPVAIEPEKNAPFHSEFAYVIFVNGEVAIEPEKNASFHLSLQEAKKTSLALLSHIQQGNTVAAESVCQRLDVKLAELSSGASTPADQLALAERFFNFGASLRQLKHDSWAERAYQSALRLSTSAASGQNTDPARRQMAACHNHLGLLYQHADSLQQSVRAFEEALVLREILFEAHPEDEENLVYLGGTLCNLGNVACDQREFDNALVWYHRSIDILDRSIPGCDCGCRDMDASAQSYMTGRPSSILIAQQFLRNALDGRASVLAKRDTGVRFVHVRCYREANCTVASILTERLVGGGTTSSADERSLREVKRELLDVITFAVGTVVFDLQSVKEMDANGAALLLHLRQRLVGSGEWPFLCGLSSELRAATPAIRWEKLFSCHATVDAAFRDLESFAGEVE